MGIRLFLTIICMGSAGLACSPREPSVDPATVEFRGGVLGRDSRTRLNQIGLKLHGRELETVYHDVTIAHNNIMEGRGIGAEMMFGGGHGKIFAINQDVPGDGYLAERSRRILGRAMREQMKNIPAIPDAKQVIVCQRDLAVTTAAIYVKPVNVQAVFNNLSQLPEEAFQYDSGNAEFEIRFNLSREHSLEVSLCLPRPWSDVRDKFPQPLRTIMDEAHRVARNEARRREAWQRANPGKTMPNEFRAPTPSGVVYLDKDSTTKESAPGDGGRIDKSQAS